MNDFRQQREKTTEQFFAQQGREGVIEAKKMINQRKKNRENREFSSYCNGNISHGGDGNEEELTDEYNFLEYNQTCVTNNREDLNKKSPVWDLIKIFGKKYIDTNNDHSNESNLDNVSHTEIMSYIDELISQIELILVRQVTMEELI